MEGTGFNEVPAFIRDGVLPSPTKILAHARHTVHQKLVGGLDEGLHAWPCPAGSVRSTAAPLEPILRCCFC